MPFGMGKGRVRLPHWLGSPAAGRCVSIRLKSFWFFLPEGFLALTRHSPQAVSAQVTLLGSSEKEQYQPGQCLNRAPCLKRRFNCFGGEPKQNESPMRAKTRRSASGAAVRRTLDGELGFALGRAVLRTRKPAAVFEPRWAEYGAGGWVELLPCFLRLKESRGPKPLTAESRNLRYSF